MKKLLIILTAGAMLSLGSCKKWLDDVSQSPNSPTEVTPALLLASAQVGLFNTYTGNLARLSSMWMQHTTGTDGQYESMGAYDVGEGEILNEWNGLYSDNLIDAQTLIDLAGDENPWYRGIGRVLKAMFLALATDCWGDVPNTEALMGLQGEASYSPHYDSQADIYADIHTLLDGAIVDLGQPSGSNSLFPSTDDYLYGGDPAAWTMAAMMLQARYAIHLAEADAGAAQDALDHLNTAYAAGLSDGSYDMNAVFPGEGNSQNQWYAFNITRGGYQQMNDGFIAMLQGDPRLSLYASLDLNNGYSGTPNCGNDLTTSVVGPFFGDIASPAPLLTFFEMKFIEAEAKSRMGDVAGSAIAGAEAVMANFIYLGLDSLTALTYIAGLPAAPTLDDIMTEKYKAMFTQLETWTDWRRTGSPSLTPVTCGPISQIPVRLPTALSERLYNTNAVVTTDLLTPVWWDQ
jgi:hypothetical protein